MLRSRRKFRLTIATAFANLSTDDSQYALANEYVNAFVSYVAVVGTDLQVPVGDPVAFALEKHGQAITTSENPNIAAYVMAHGCPAKISKRKYRIDN